jgi:hypothetical protein
MYLSADDARSDFFLAAAVYVIGPTLVSLLLRFVPDGATTGVAGVAVSIVTTVLVTAAMPLFLLRYREGSFAPLRTGGARGLGTGAAIGAVALVAVALAEVLGGADLPVLVDLLTPGIVLLVVVRWASLAVLAIFLHVRAEHAFRPVSEHQQTLVRRAGIAVTATLGVSALLLVLSGGLPVWSLLAVAGIAAAYPVAERLLPPSGVGERWWVWAPPITLALGPLDLFGFLRGGAGFLLSAQQAAVAALVGLVALMGLHARRGAAVAWGFAGALAGAALLALGRGSGVAL